MRELITTKEVAKRLNRSQRQVNRLINAGKIKRVEGVLSNRGGTLILWMEQYLNEFGQGEQTEQKPTGNDHRLYFDEWYRWAKNGWISKRPLSENTLNKYRNSLKRFFAKYYQVNPDTLKLMLEEYSIHQYGSRHDVYSGVSSFAKFLVKNDLADPSLLSEIKKYRPERLGEPKRTVLTEEDVKKLFNFIDTYPHLPKYSRLLNHTLVSLFLYTGLRVSEVANLTLDNIDLTNGVLQVIKGKGNKNRAVGMPEPLIQSLTNYLKQRPDTELNSLFINCKKKQLKTRQIQLRVQRLSEKAGINITAHGFRRTYATLCSKVGMPVEYISKSLGHADLSTTERYLMTTQQQVVERMRTLQLPI